MNRSNKGTYILMAIFGVLVILVAMSYSSYYAADPTGQSLFTYAMNIDEAVWKLSWNDYTLKIITVFLLIYSLGCLYYASTRKHYRFGEEFGSANFASPKALCKQYADRKKNNNRIVSKNIQLSYDGYKTQINNHVLVIGGSGSGKTRYVVKPNAMQLHDSMVIVDPDGGTLASTGNMFVNEGFKVKVLNLIDMFSSDFYNPFKYIYDDKDILKLITNFMKNTTPKDAQKEEPFWDNSAKMFLQAIMYYIWYEAQPEEKNWNTLLEMIKYAQLKYDEKGNRLKTPLDMLFEELKKEKPDHPAIMPYEKTMGGAEETVKSILQIVDTRLIHCNISGIKHIFSGDSIDLESIATEKTVLFCVIPEDDDTFNFVMGMLYTQMYQVLFNIAKKSETGRLPLDVTVIMDEFANVAIPDGFKRILATARKYGINIWILLQSIAQLKPMFKENGWEEIRDNCDTQIYLGGNSETTFKGMSERIGKETIDKRSYSIGSGSRGSSSRSEDITGRDLMTQDEVGRMPNNKCLVFIRGNSPVMDNKYNIKKHPNYRKIADGKKGKKYEHKIIRINNIDKLSIDFNNLENIEMLA